jgi:hypothetical protein
MQSNAKTPTKKAKDAEKKRIALSVWVHPSLQLPFKLHPSIDVGNSTKLTCPFEMDSTNLVNDLLQDVEDVLNKEADLARGRKGGLYLDIRLNVIWNVKDHSAALNPNSTVGDHFVSGDTSGVHGEIVESEVGDYKEVAAGMLLTALLRNDGRAAVCGSDLFDREKRLVGIPVLVEGFSYKQVAVHRRAFLLQSDGAAKTYQWRAGQPERDIPALADGVGYEQVSAGDGHAVFLGAMALPQPAEGMTAASATSRRWRTTCATRRFRLDITTPFSFGTTSLPWPAAAMIKASAICRRWRTACATCRFRLDITTPFSSGAMAPPSRVAVRTVTTARVYMALLYSAARATFQSWRRVCATRRFLLEVSTPFFSAAMALLQLVEATPTASATFRRCQTVCATIKLPPDLTTQFC